MSFLAPDADDEFVGRLVQHHIFFGDKRKLQFEVIVAVYFVQTVRFFFKKALQRISFAVNLIGQAFEVVIADDLTLKQIYG